MELGEGRDSLLGEEDTLYIVGEKIQPLPTYSARDTRYYRTRPRYYRKELRYYRSGGSDQTRPCCVKTTSGRTAGAVLPRALAVLPQGRVRLGWEGTD
jgi:hypothetical protein